MKASITMLGDVVGVPPELPLRRAWRLMLELRIRHLPVAQSGALIGFLSDREEVLRASADGQGTPEVDGCVVGEAITLQPRTRHATTTVSQLTQATLDDKIDALVVVADDDRRKVIGLVTSTDLLWLLVVDEPRALALDYMVRTVSREGAVSREGTVAAA
ncbi:MAG: CBS domain-containing protein [Deltaproteobacteria bacterium]|nr:CBS domain-containing protein [Deltaproteobacteria bacterium]